MLLSLKCNRYREKNELDIKESLDIIMNHPLNKDRPASYLLGPPMTEEEIILTLQPVYKVTHGLKTLEAEADGHPLKDIWLIPGYYLLSLREVVETLLIMTRTSGVWNPSWLPCLLHALVIFLFMTLKTDIYMRS
ncbi:hypothetical protein ACJMK2_021811 [Sinanodonta woodiana]|uniref:Uncharacterized protein n=1 Tax=Sinanodonta woodiana TaxID=1069815 RepID=A0ABD3TIT7_SINWO